MEWTLTATSSFVCAASNALEMAFQLDFTFSQTVILDVVAFSYFSFPFVTSSAARINDMRLYCTGL
eukprot:2715078-Amphidinium_carterae.1